MRFLSLKRPNVLKRKECLNDPESLSSESLTSRLGLFQDEVDDSNKRHKALSCGPRKSSSGSGSDCSDNRIQVIVSRPFSASSLSEIELDNSKIASAQNPVDYLCSITRFTLTVDEIETLHNRRSSNNQDGYTNEVIRAIQTRDVNYLRKMVQQGRSMHCCNRFGESILHMACRRGFEDVVRFLVYEANVEVAITDDYGRTPLHDAFWAAEPNFDLVEILVQTAPQLLFLRDKRNHTPLQYARRMHWADWNKFLKERKPVLIRSLGA